VLSWHGTPYRVFIAIGHGLCARHGGGQHSIEGVEHLSGTLFRFFLFFLVELLPSIPILVPFFRILLLEIPGSPLPKPYPNSEAFLRKRRHTPVGVAW